MLLPSQDPMSLTERGTELFLPVFGPTVEVGNTILRDTPRDAILVKPIAHSPGQGQHAALATSPDENPSAVAGTPGPGQSHN